MKWTVSTVNGLAAQAQECLARCPLNQAVTQPYIFVSGAFRRLQANEEKENERVEEGVGGGIVSSRVERNYALRVCSDGVASFGQYRHKSVVENSVQGR